MADPIAPVTNGAAAPAPAVEGGEAAVDRSKMTRAQQHEADRAAFVAADLTEDNAAQGKPAPKKEKAPAPKLEDLPDAEDDAGADASQEDEDDLDDDLDDLDDDVKEDEDAEDDDAPKDADPAIAQAHAKIRKLETRAREGIARDKAALDTERNAFIAEWKPKIEALNAFEKLKGKKSDPVSILRSLGYTDDEFEDAAKIIYGHSKAAAADPKNREAVRQLQEKKELREQVAAAQARTEALEARLNAKDEGAANEAKIATYLGRVTKSVNAEATPILKEMLELAPNKTRKALDVIASRLATKSGAKNLDDAIRMVDPKKVALAYEKQRRAAGVTVESVKALRKAPAITTAAVGAKPTKAKASAITVVDKTTKASDKPVNGYKSKAELIEDLYKIERGELDPNAD